MRKRLNLSLINENLLYKVLSIPSFSEKEYRMQDFLLEYSRQKGITASMDGKGNIYLCKGSLTEGHFYPCVSAHMDTLQERQIPYIEANKPIPLLTEKMDWIYHNVSCRAAIKGGNTSTDEELIALAKQVEDEDVRHCPHGRPVCIIIKKHELERQFGRV